MTQWHDEAVDLRSQLTTSNFRTAFGNLSSPIATLTDHAAFLQPITPNGEKDKVLPARHAGGFWNELMHIAPLPSRFLPSNFATIFAEDGKLQDKELSGQLAELSRIVLRNERALGFVPERSIFTITSAQEPTDRPGFRQHFNQGKTDFHRDALLSPWSRIYFVSDTVCPTLVKIKAGAVLTTRPFTVYCMTGATEHSRGPVLPPPAGAALPAVRKFARMTVTGGFPR